MPNGPPGPPFVRDPVTFKCDGCGNTAPGRLIDFRIMMPAGWALQALERKFGRDPVIVCPDPGCAPDREFPGGPPKPPPGHPHGPPGPPGPPGGGPP